MLRHRRRSVGGQDLSWLFMKRRSDRLRRLLAHWPELTERQRLALVIAVFVNGVVTMGLELVTLAAVWRAGRRGWRARRDGTAAVTRAISAKAALRLAAISVGQKLTARTVFTSYEGHLRRRGR